MSKMLYHHRNNETIKTCDPVAQIAMRYLMYRLSRSGESVLVTDGLRGKQEQEKAFNAGYSQVKWPYSFHNHGVAIDIAPVLFGQSIVVYNQNKRYENIAKIAEKCGFQWGFSMWGWDKPHFQYTQGHDITYFINGGKLNPRFAKDAAREYYTSELKKIENAMKYAGVSRMKKLVNERILVLELLKDCD